MLSTGGPGPAPGWYPDPAGGLGLRWWNGTAWTSQSSIPVPPVFSGIPGPNPRTAQESEARKLPWAKAAIWFFAVEPLVLAVMVFLVWGDAAHWFSEIRTTLNTLNNASPNQTIPFPAPPGALHAVIWLSFIGDALQTAATVVLMVFMYNAASHARDLGLPARLTPVWAVLGWIVPVVNLWFPYWVLRDCLPPHETRGRDLALRWWLFQIFSFVPLVAVLIACWVNPLLGVVFIAGEVVYAVLQACSGCAAVDRICRSHEELTSALVAPGMNQVR